MAILKDLRYETAADVSSRLGRSIVRYKGQPVWAEYADDGGLNLNLTNVISGDRFNGIHSSDEDIDVRAFQTGYVNTPRRAYYATRVPSRRPKQGLATDNCVWWYFDTQQNTRRSCPIGRGDITSKYFFEMLNEKYPSLEDCIKKIKNMKPKFDDMGDVTPSAAFSRKLAIQEDEIGVIKLHYFCQPIAMFNSKREEFVLSERLEHYLPFLKSMEIPVSTLLE